MRGSLRLRTYGSMCLSAGSDTRMLRDVQAILLLSHPSVHPTHSHHLIIVRVPTGRNPHAGTCRPSYCISHPSIDPHIPVRTRRLQSRQQSNMQPRATPAQERSKRCVQPPQSRQSGMQSRAPPAQESVASGVCSRHDPTHDPTGEPTSQTHPRPGPSTAASSSPLKPA